MLRYFVKSQQIHLFESLGRFLSSQIIALREGWEGHSEIMIYPGDKLGIKLININYTRPLPTVSTCYTKWFEL